MSTVEGNCVPLERLKELVREPDQANTHAIAVLLTLLSDDEETRAWASDVLTELNPPASVANQLVELTRHVNAPLAGWACKLIAKLPNAADHQTAVANALRNHPEISVRQVAALALGQLAYINGDSKEALEIASRASDARLSRLATQALSAAKD